MSVIQYNLRKAEIEVGVPFTWGTRNAWAIKVEGGDVYFLSNGKPVHTTDAEIIDSGIVYANSIEIQ